MSHIIRSGLVAFLLSAVAARRIGRVRTDRANYRGSFPPSLSALVSRAGERFATERDERLVAAICEELGLVGSRPAEPASAPQAEQLPLF